ncbi:hypothetical protein LTS10_011776 [Elasticomyces elasticus]|nr:hypothetical protein LTS10_011776 [Elasticomyces elasticus]
MSNKNTAPRRSRRIASQEPEELAVIDHIVAQNTTLDERVSNLTQRKSSNWDVIAASARIIKGDRASALDMWENYSNVQTSALKCSRKFEPDPPQRRGSAYPLGDAEGDLGKAFQLLEGILLLTLDLFETPTRSPDACLLLFCGHRTSSMLTQDVYSMSEGSRHSLIDAYIEAVPGDRITNALSV